MEWLRSNLVLLLSRIIHGFVFIGLLLIGSLAASVQAGGSAEADKDVEYELTLLAAPPFGYINTLENVKFSVIALKRPKDVVDTVRLIQTDAEGNPIAEAGVMSDDGQNGDYKGGDSEYTLTLTFNESTPVTRYYQAVVSLKNDSRKILSQVRRFWVAEKSYSKEPDEDKIVYDQGIPFPVNQVIIRLPEGETKITAQALANLVNGKVVGYASTLNHYLLEVPTSTVEELDAVIDRLDADPRTVHAKRNLMLEPELE